MAITKRYTKIIYGKELEFSESYNQITHISGDKNNIEFQLTMYDNNSKNNIVEQKNYVFSPVVTDDSVNFIKQGYEYLKTLPEYVDAIDC